MISESYVQFGNLLFNQVINTTLFTIDNTNLQFKFMSLIYVTQSTILVHDTGNLNIDSLQIQRVGTSTCFNLTSVNFNI